MENSMTGQLNTEIKVSVIMPVYRVEAYVAKAITSILGQCCADGSAFTDWELIAVDDGTPDRSGEICEAFAAKDARIRVLRQKNSGAPAARNHAIRIARGKYLFFMDSDDYCEPTMLADLYELAESAQAELVISGFYIDTYYKIAEREENGKTLLDEQKSRYLTTDYIPETGVYETKEAFRRAAYKLFDKNMLYPPWNKLYLRSYIVENGLYFPQTFWDDFPFVLSVIRDVSRVAVTERQYYHFLRARSESETAKYVPKMYEKREEEHRWMVGLYRYWKLWEADGAENREMVQRRYLDRLIGCFENLTNPKCTLSRAEKEKTVREMLKQKTVDEALREARPRALYTKLLYLSIRMKSVRLVLAEAGVITWVKTNNMKLFAVLKSRR